MSGRNQTGDKSHVKKGRVGKKTARAIAPAVITDIIFKLSECSVLLFRGIYQSFYTPQMKPYSCHQSAGLTLPVL